MYIKVIQNIPCGSSRWIDCMIDNAVSVTQTLEKLSEKRDPDFPREYKLLNKHICTCPDVCGVRLLPLSL